MPEVDLTFVPGAAGLGSFWHPIAERLPPTWSKRCLDLPGLGPVPPRADVQSYSDLADFVARSIERPTVLVAQSMGALVALLLTLRYPALVRRLVLVAAAGGVDMARHGAFDWRPLDREQHAVAPAWRYAPTPDLSGALGKITIPVLLLWATRDAISPLGVAEQLKKQLPHAELVTFDSDDHWVARSFAEETSATLSQWLHRHA